LVQRNKGVGMYHIRALLALSGLLLLACNEKPDVAISPENNSSHGEEIIDFNDKSLDDYRIPFIELTTDSFYRIFPDDFCYTRNDNIEKINISEMKGNDSLFTNSFSYNSDGFLSSIRLYSDGDYYKTDFQYNNSLLESEVKYVDTVPSKKIHSYIYTYKNIKDPNCTVLDDEKNVIRICKTSIENNAAIVIKIYNDENELVEEYKFNYESNVIRSLSVIYPPLDVNYQRTIPGTVKTTEINYVDGRIDSVQVFYNDSNDNPKLSIKKEFNYGSSGELLELVMTRYLSTTNEIEKIVFSGHDSHGNWTMYKSDRIYKREIFYRN
jgi:hypothetical protein